MVVPACSKCAPSKLPSTVSALAGSIAARCWERLQRALSSGWQDAHAELPTKAADACTAGVAPCAFETGGSRRLHSAPAASSAHASAANAIRARRDARRGARSFSLEPRCMGMARYRLATRSDFGVPCSEARGTSGGARDEAGPHTIRMARRARQRALRGSDRSPGRDRSAALLERRRGEAGDRRASSTRVTQPGGAGLRARPPSASPSSTTTARSGPSSRSTSSSPSRSTA